MASTTLTIRNLTSTSLTLKHVERYEVPTSEPRSIFSNFTSAAWSNSTAGPSQTALLSHIKSFSQSDVFITIAPFTVAKTEIPTTEKDILRLTIEKESGEGHRIDVRTSKESLEFTALGPDPTSRYTGIWLEQTSFLAIYSSANLNAWMRELSDLTPLSGLSIPGTHNSPTYHKALPSVRCQSVSLLHQLTNGIRFLDVRVQVTHPGDPTSDSLTLVHGAFPVALTGPKYLRPLISTLLTFLSQNPSETIILCLKREGTGPGTDPQLSQLLHTHYTSPDPSLYFTEPRIPLLGEARGKIILMRRFELAAPQRALHNETGFCLDAHLWPDNTPGANSTSNSVCVQDFYNVLDPSQISQKIQFCCEHFERAGQQRCPIPGITCDGDNPVPPGPLYLNFLSGSNFFRPACWPGEIAKRVNPEVVGWLCERHGVGGSGKGEGMIDEGKDDGGVVGDGGVGIVVCDWVGHKGDWDLVRCVVGMNARLEMIGKGSA